MEARSGKPRPGPSDIRVRIGERILAARDEQGYTRAELTRMIVAAGSPNITATQVRRWERGEAMPKPENFAILEQVLGVLLC